MKRLLVGILVSAIMFGGCARDMDVYKYDRSHPPLNQQTQIPINRLWLDDQLQQHQIFYGELADNQKVPPDGTMEMDPTQQDHMRTANESFGGAILGYFAPAIILPVAIVALPFIGAHELLKAPDAKAAAGPGNPKEMAQAQNPVDTKTGTNLATDDKRILSQQRHAQWLASVVMEGQWSSALDDAYISALNQALGWKTPPVEGSVEQYKPQQDGKSTSAPVNRHFRAGISKIALLDSSSGARTLILCARSIIQPGGVIVLYRDTLIEKGGGTVVRYFETCQSGNIGFAMPYDSPASSEALRAVLVEQAGKLAALQARTLTEQTTFVQAPR